MTKTSISKSCNKAGERKVVIDQHQQKYKKEITRWKGEKLHDKQKPTQAHFEKEKNLKENGEENFILFRGTRKLFRGMRQERLKPTVFCFSTETHTHNIPLSSRRKKTILEIITVEKSTMHKYTFNYLFFENNGEKRHLKIFTQNVIDSNILYYFLPTNLCCTNNSSII